MHKNCYSVGKRYLIIVAQEILQFWLLQGSFQVVPVVVDLLALFLHTSVLGLFFFLGLFGCGTTIAVRLTRFIFYFPLPFGLEIILSKVFSVG